MQLFPDLSPFIFKKLPERERKESFEPKKEQWHLHLPGAELLFAPRFFSPEHSNLHLSYLLQREADQQEKIDWQTAETEQLEWKNIPWKRDIIKMFGKEVQIPRLSAWHGDPEARYSYSGLELPPNPWNEGLLTIKTAIEKVAETCFNSVLLNWYRDGNDHMSWHSDDEPELGHNPIIASVNLGASRRFLLRRKKDHQQKVELALGHGSLLIMRGACQHHWQHAVPKQKKVKSDRVNLTFRWVG